VLSEATARSTDFEARGTIGNSQSRLGEGGSSAGQAVFCGLDESQRALATPSEAQRTRHKWQMLPWEDEHRCQRRHGADRASVDQPFAIRGD